MKKKVKIQKATLVFVELPLFEWGLNATATIRFLFALKSKAEMSNPLPVLLHSLKDKKGVRHCNFIFVLMLVSQRQCLWLTTGVSSTPGAAVETAAITCMNRNEYIPDVIVVIRMSGSWRRGIIAIGACSQCNGECQRKQKTN